MEEGDHYPDERGREYDQLQETQALSGAHWRHDVSHI
jgi:hypothetical protein